MIYAGNILPTVSREALDGPARGKRSGEHVTAAEGPTVSDRKAGMLTAPCIRNSVAPRGASFVRSTGWRPPT
jgi:hypothetical protein